MKVFVTGSTGLLGNNLVRALIARGHEVVGLVRSEEKGRRLLGDGDMCPTTARPVDDDAIVEQHLCVGSTVKVAPLRE